ncbi:MAG: acyl-CoA dehydrogenase family protein [Azospirillaceae bacterium]
MTDAVALAARDDRPVAYPPTTAGLNAFTTDRGLRARLALVAPDLLADHGARLDDFGAWVAGPLDEQAAYTDRHAPPRLETHDRDGAAVGRVIVNPAYRDCHMEAYRRGAIAAAFGPGAAPHRLSFVMGYLLSYADIAIHCPVTMTGAVAYVLDRLAPAPVREAWLPGLLRSDGRTATGGTWATERHGGSDVGATTTRAVPEGDNWRLTGLKWFTSNAGSGVALATARPSGAAEGSAGLGCYLVPDRLPDGTPNTYRVRRLKEKAGTRGLPTGEIDLDGTWAVEVAPPPEGLRAMMEALEYSRIHNAASGAGLQRRAFVEAACWATHRHAFGAPLIGRPMVRDRLLDLLADQEASLALALEAGSAFDAALADPSARPWLRTVTAIAKYETAERACRSARAAVELVGGNGYTEEWPTARLYRDSLVTAVWEGPANIQALELARAALGKYRGDTAFLERVDRCLSGLPDGAGALAGPLATARADCAAALEGLRARLERIERDALRLLVLMADTLGAALLCEGAADGLARGDRRLALLAERFLARRFGGRAPIAGDDAPLEAALADHAEAVLGQARIPVE